MKNYFFDASFNTHFLIHPCIACLIAFEISDDAEKQPVKEAFYLSATMQYLLLFYTFAAMIKSLTAILLACFFLTGSTLLPLGDFSLMKELPGMYRSYCQVKVGEPDVIDFAGDYLLGGKDLLGHNQNDTTPKSDGSLQFQHQANSFLIILLQVKTASSLLAEALSKPVASHPLLFTTEYQNKLFRPPLA